MCGLDLVQQVTENLVNLLACGSALVSHLEQCHKAAFPRPCKLRSRSDCLRVLVNANAHPGRGTRVEVVSVRVAFTTLPFPDSIRIHRRSHAVEVEDAIEIVGPTLHLFHDSVGKGWKTTS